MIQENIVIEVERRRDTGKNAANRLRAAGRIPAVIYGGGSAMETLSLSVPRKELVTLLRKGLHENAIFLLKLKGTDQERHVMIRDLTVHPVGRDILHVDFVRVLLDKKLRVKSAVAVTGIPYGVKTEGGTLNVVTHELAIECLPADIPHSIEVDVTPLKIGDSLRVSDVKVPPKVTILEHADRVVAHVTHTRAEVEAAPAAAEAAAAAPTAAAEPEVIKKGKKEEEGAEAKAKGEKKEKK